MASIDLNLLWYFESSHTVPRFFCAYVSGKSVIVRSGEVGTRGHIDETIRCANAWAARLRAPDEVEKRATALGRGWERYRRVLAPDVSDLDTRPEKLPKGVLRQRPALPPSVQALSTLVSRPEHAALAAYVAKQRILKDIEEVEFQKPPRTRTKVWQPASACGVVVFEQPCVVSGNVIAGIDGRGGTLIFLGGLHAKNLFLAPDTEVLCAGPCEVDELFFAATQDSSFTTFTSLSARVVYAGHGDAWPTVAAGSVEVDVIDDYIEGKGIRAKRPKLRAAELVQPSLLDDDGDLEREAVLEAFFSTTKLLR